MITCILLLFASCGGGKTNDQEQIVLYPDPPFKVADVYSQKWVAGVPDGGSGTNVHFTLVEFSRDVTIDKVYFREQVTKAQISPQTRNQFAGYFRNNNRRDVIMDIDPVKEAKNTPKTPFPFKLNDNEAVLSFLDGNFVRYTKITDIREEEMLALPSVKPNNEN
ncbi:hypothetical protein J1N09_09035 [Aureitalea sp. L0-47]|uniref:hypothetical protein n=1 Tax=Aureitalea sp. L0-47 TaxID=2816962 RepID=UPI0022386DCE|nr:hypothetical protein [Aureitalea sp. L0-47]MCW5519980.1 hypothetical protein [Aureitalea sp. L0-47]